MGDVVDFEAFKAAKLKRLEDEWAMCMDRAAVFQQDGKRKFAEEMIAKAKILRKQIDKLRKPQPSTLPLSYDIPPGGILTSIRFEGFSGADMGHRRSEITPEPENN